MMGLELGDRGFTGAAISEWEHGKSRIQADHRIVLVCLVKVLHDCGGLHTLAEANEFLESGDYRALNEGEAKKIFRQSQFDLFVQPASSTLLESRSGFLWTIGTLLFESPQEFQGLLTKAEEGPLPSWPRVLAMFMRKVSERWSLSVTGIFWLAVWLLAWWLIAPSLRWPFVDRSSAFSAIVKYMAGTLVVPLLIGLLINTKNSKYWKQQNPSSSFLLRLYTYQGAGIGFNLGYFFVLPLVLVMYFLQLGSSIWLEIAAVTLGLILGNMGARVVPHNLWVAYGRLHLTDGAIFFVVAFIGPLWGLFFLEFYPVLLTPLLGIIMILSAVILAVFFMKRQRKGASGKNGDVPG